MKTTLARHTGGTTSVEFVPIDEALILPTARTYGKKEASPKPKVEPAMASSAH